MKRKLFAFSMTMALLLSMLSVAGVGAHTIAIEDNVTVPSGRTEWFGLQPDVAGTGAVQRNSAQFGEYVFNDASKDQRLITGSPEITRAGDLDWFSVTADANKVYFLAKVDKYAGITQSPAINLIITIDNKAGGNAVLPVAATNPVSDVNVPSDALWEYAINAQFKPGNSSSNGRVPANKLFVYDSANPSGKNCTSCAGQLVSAAISAGSFVELSMPWAAFNAGGNPLKPTTANDKLRFVVALTYNNQAIPIDGFNSPVIDVIGTNKNTLADIGDGTIDTSFDVHFNPNVPVGGAASFEPYSPLQITEFQANPPGKDTPGSASSVDSEWIEIYNPNSFAVALTDYKIGNAAARGSSSQGMFKFKSGSLASKGLLIVARSKADFLKSHPGYAGTLLDLNADLTKYSAWATGDLDLDNIGGLAVEEQVVLLDGKDGIVDMVTYGSPTAPTPGNVPIRLLDVPEGATYERCPATLDTNGGFVNKTNNPSSNTDFVPHSTLAEQTPGTACVGRTGLDESIAKTGPTVATVGTDVVFELTYSNIGISDELPGAQTTITDTLPAEMTFQSASFQDAPLVPTSVSGQNVVFKVTPPPAGGQAFTIVLTATIAPSAPENTALTNRAVISSPNEPKDTATQSNNQSEWTVTTLGPALLDVSLAGLTAAPPGQQFAFSINYVNNGQSVAEGTAISLQIPANITLLSVDSSSATPSFGLPVSGPTTVTFTGDQLDALEGGSITIIGRVAVATPAKTVLPFQTTLSSTTAGVASDTANGSLTADFLRMYMPFVRK